MEIKLEPCPFCGSEAKIVMGKGSHKDYANVECGYCHAKTDDIYESLNYCAKEEVAKIWNKRV